MFIEEHRNPLVVRNMLQLSNHDFSRLLEQSLIAPCWIENVKVVGDSIVFADPDRVHRYQCCEQKQVAWVAAA